MIFTESHLVTFRSARALPGRERAIADMLGIADMEEAMVIRSQKKSVTQQLAIWLLLIALASFSLWFAYATLSDFWVLFILWANG